MADWTPLDLAEFLGNGAFSVTCLTTSGGGKRSGQTALRFILQF